MKGNLGKLWTIDYSRFIHSSSDLGHDMTLQSTPLGAQDGPSDIESLHREKTHTFRRQAQRAMSKRPPDSPSSISASGVAVASRPSQAATRFINHSSNQGIHQDDTCVYTCVSVHIDLFISVTSMQIYAKVF